MVVSNTVFAVGLDGSQFGSWTTPIVAPQKTPPAAGVNKVADKEAVAVCAVGVEESVTWTVKEKVPIAVGVPAIVPVEAFSSNPGGNEPVTTLQLYGWVPPVAASVVL